MEWIYVDKGYPPEGEYVLIETDGYVGISRLMDGEWDVGGGRRRPMFNKCERVMSKLDAIHWAPLPPAPKE